MTQENASTKIFIFVAITAVYCFSRWMIFKGFNGTDDLHYSMLAANVLNGRYSPFVPGDIFAGRAGLIYTQALIYFIGGITVFTTQVATLFVTVLDCYLTVFKLGKFRNTGSILVASSLFYFNPVLNEVALGVMPDVYVMLAGIVILILWKNIFVARSKRKLFLNSVLIALTALAAMFFKENALIFIPFIICAGIFHRKNSGIKASAIAIGTFIFGIFICGLLYQHFTVDFFFRLRQIQNSNYLNPCNYSLLHGNELLIRLTYGVWTEFISSGFYPVVLAAFLITAKFVSAKNFKVQSQPFVFYFIALMILGLYFPFSFTRYEPLCFRARHFIFLYPLGVVIVAQFFSEVSNRNKKLRMHFVVASFVLFILCILATGEKWYWMMCGLFFGCFLLLFLMEQHFVSRLRYLAFSCIAWLFMPYHLVFQNSDWFKNLQSLSPRLTGLYFYFPEHDNMSHFKLLHHFDNSYHIYNIEPHPFKIFKLYYEDDSTFHPGWLIVNNTYTLRSQRFLDSIRDLDAKNYFSDKKIEGDVAAYYISNSTQYLGIKRLTTADSDGENNCCN